MSGHLGQGSCGSGVTQGFPSLGPEAQGMLGPRALGPGPRRLRTLRPYAHGHGAPWAQGTSATRFMAMPQ